MWTKEKAALHEQICLVGTGFMHAGFEIPVRSVLRSQVFELTSQTP